MTVGHLPIEQLLPHGPSMVLLDEVLSVGDDALSAAVVIRRSAPFFEPGGVPCHIGIEYMAQACGAFAGAEARAAGEAVRIGYLLGTRRFTSVVDRFAEGDRLIVTAALSYRDEAMGVFDCRIERLGEKIATAQLTVFQPPHSPSAAPARGPR